MLQQTTTSPRGACVEQSPNQPNLYAINERYKQKTEIKANSKNERKDSGAKAMCESKAPQS
jgi:hypothetical protein